MKGYTWNLRGDHSYDGSAAVGYDIIIQLLFIGLWIQAVTRKIAFHF